VLDQLRQRLGLEHLPADAHTERTRLAPRAPPPLPNTRTHAGPSPVEPTDCT
jgi:hypothetical protein